MVVEGSRFTRSGVEFIRLKVERSWGSGSVGPALGLGFRVRDQTIYFDLSLWCWESFSLDWVLGLTI